MPSQKVFSRQLQKLVPSNRLAAGARFKGTFNEATFTGAFFQLARKFLLEILQYVHERLPDGAAWERNTISISRPGLMKPGHSIRFELNSNIPFTVEVDNNGQKSSVMALDVDSTGRAILKILDQGQGRQATKREATPKAFAGLYKKRTSPLG